MMVPFYLNKSCLFDLGILYSSFLNPISPLFDIRAKQPIATRVVGQAEMREEIAEMNRSGYGECKSIWEAFRSTQILFIYCFEIPSMWPSMACLCKVNMAAILQPMILIYFISYRLSIVLFSLVAICF